MLSNSPEEQNNEILKREQYASFFVILLLSALIISEFIIGFRLSIFLPIIIVAGVLVFLHPRTGLFTSIFLTIIFERFYTLEPIVIGENVYKLYPIDIILVVLFFATLLYFIRERAWKRFITVDYLLLSFFLFLCVYFVLNVFGVFGGSGIEKGFSTWKNYVFYGAIYFPILLLFPRLADMKQIQRYFFYGSLGVLFFVVSGILFGGGFWTEYTPLSTSGIRILAFPHSFYLSLAFLGLVLSAPFWLKSTARYVLWTLLLFWTVGIVGGLMRHLWLALFITLMFGFFFIAREMRKELWSLVSGLIVVALAGFVTLFFVGSLTPFGTVSTSSTQVVNVVQDRILSIGNTADESLSWRSAVWQSAFHDFSKNPLFGLGFGRSVPVEIGEYREFVEITNVHNSWLVLLFQLGIVGGAIFLSFFLRLWWKLFRKGDIGSEEGRYFRRLTLLIAVFYALIMLSQPYLETNLLSFFFWINLGMMRVLIDMKE